MEDKIDELHEFQEMEEQLRKVQEELRKAKKELVSLRETFQSLELQPRPVKHVGSMSPAHATHFDDTWFTLVERGKSFKDHYTNLIKRKCKAKEQQFFLEFSLIIAGGKKVTAILNPEQQNNYMSIDLKQNELNMLSEEMEETWLISNGAQHRRSNIRTLFDFYLGSDKPQATTANPTTKSTIQTTTNPITYSIETIYTASGKTRIIRTITNPITKCTIPMYIVPDWNNGIMILGINFANQYITDMNYTQKIIKLSDPRLLEFHYSTTFKTRYYEDPNF